MKKALTITIAGTLFTIEEDAYHKLDEYLKSIQAYFGSYPDSREIVNDIEARIAEQLSESRKKNNDVVNLTAVDELIKTMGKVEDFEDRSESEAKTEHSHSAKNTKKLYRDSDDVVIAGVASGIAHYFDVDPLMIRLAFILLTILTSGAGVILYVIFALVIPKADTPADKVRMQGGPVKLSSFRETVDEKIDQVKAKGKDIIRNPSGFRRMIEGFVRFIGKFALLFARLISGIIGFALTFGAVIAMAALTFLLVNFVFNLNSPYIEFPISQVISGVPYYFFIAFAYIVILFPLIFIVSLGSSFMSWRKKISVPATVSLASIWLVALIIAGSIAVRYAPEAKVKISTLPQYQTASTTSDLKDFTKLHFDGTERVNVIQGKEFTISAQGKQIDIDRVEFKVEDGVLLLSERPQNKVCVFCFGNGRLDITVTMPTIEDIDLGGVVSLTAKTLIVSDFSLTTADVASANITLKGKEISVKNKDASHATLSGNADTLKLTVSDVSRFDGMDFAVNEATVDTKDVGRAIVNADQKLSATASDVSRITYFGKPTVTKDLDDHAKIEKAK